jgi:hypothetical protein
MNIIRIDRQALGNLSGISPEHHYYYVSSAVMSHGRFIIVIVEEIMAKSECDFQMA